MEKLLAILLLHSQAMGAEMGINYGVALPTDSDFLTQVKTFAINYSEGHTLRTKYEVGLYTDPRRGDGRKTSGYASASIGIRPQLKGLLVESFWGLGAITSPDTNLGGAFNFFHSISIGVIDNQYNSIAFSYKHISSAGIYSPNIGRDFITLNWGFKL